MTVVKIIALALLAASAPIREGKADRIGIARRSKSILAFGLDIAQIKAALYGRSLSTIRRAEQRIDQLDAGAEVRLSRSQAQAEWRLLRRTFDWDGVAGRGKTRAGDEYRDETCRLNFSTHAVPPLSPVLST